MQKGVLGTAIRKTRIYSVALSKWYNLLNRKYNMYGTC